jgi:hypothetical protein
LREDQDEVGGRGVGLKGLGVGANKGMKRQFRVKDMMWNSDSTVLAVWIEREFGDVGEFQQVVHLSDDDPG